MPPRYFGCFLLLVAVVFLPSQPAFAMGTGANPVPAPSGVSLVVGRSEFATTTLGTDAEYHTRFGTEPLNFEDSEGHWLPIDETLQRRSDGSLHSTSVDGDSSIPASLSQPLTVTHDGSTLRMRMVDGAGTRTYTGRDAFFSAVQDGVDATYSEQADGLKETIRLNEPSAPHSFSYEIVVDDDLSAQQNNDGSLDFVDSDGGRRFRVSAPVAWDSERPAAYSNAVAIAAFKLAPGRWRVKVAVDDAWASSPARVYPVNIDPTVTWMGGTQRISGADADCSIGSGAASMCALRTLTIGNAGSQNFKALLRFDLAKTIPPGSSISSAALSMYLASTDNATPPSTTMYPRTVTSPWDNTATWLNSAGTTPWAVAGGDVSSDLSLTGAATAVSQPGFWYRWPVPVKVTTGWVDGDLPNFGLSMGIVPGQVPNTVYNFTSTEGTAAQRPLLDVAWKPNTMDGFLRTKKGAVARYLLTKTNNTMLADPATDPSADTALVDEEGAQWLRDVYDTPPAGSTASEESSAVQATVQGEEVAAEMDGAEGLVTAAAETAAAAPELLPAIVVVGAAAATFSYFVYRHDHSGTPLEIPGKLPATPFHVDNWTAPQNVQFPTYVDPAPWPPGLVAQRFNGPGPIYWQENAVNPACNQTPITYPAGVADFSWVWQSSCGSNNNAPSTAHGAFAPYTSVFAVTPGTPAVPGHDVVTGTLSEGVTEAQAEVVVAGALDSGKTAELNQVLGHALGDDVPDPRWPHAVVPDCHGLTYAACVTKLQQAGFHGTITQKTIPLTADDPSVALGSAVSTSPAGGRDLNTGEPIVVNVELPTDPDRNHRPRITQLRDDLLAKNPLLVKAGVLTPDNATQIADECERRRTAANAGTAGLLADPDSCTKLKILVLGQDVEKPAQHDRNVMEGVAAPGEPAFAARPQLFFLHARTSGKRGWYRSTPGPCNAVVQPLAPHGQQCDEFPYNATYEGYVQGQGAPLPHLRYLDASQNQLEGTLLNKFYSASAVGRLDGTAALVRGCGVTKNAVPATPSDRDAMPPAPESAYLLLPMPETIARSFSICNVGS